MNDLPNGFYVGQRVRVKKLAGNYLARLRDSVTGFVSDFSECQGNLTIGCTSRRARVNFDDGLTDFGHWHEIEPVEAAQPAPSEGLRFNAGKPRYDLLEPRAIAELVQVFTKGAAKYEPHNYLKGMAWSKCDASLQRHLAAWRMGVGGDLETGCLHMAHVAWNALALVSYELLALGEDDRFHKRGKPGSD